MLGISQLFGQLFEFENDFDCFPLLGESQWQVVKGEVLFGFSGWLQPCDRKTPAASALPLTGLLHSEPAASALPLTGL